MGQEAIRRPFADHPALSVWELRRSTLQETITIATTRVQFAVGRSIIFALSSLDMLGNRLFLKKLPHSNRRIPF